MPQVQKMTNVDYFYVVSELLPTVNGFLNKIYEPRDNYFRFKIRGEKEFNFKAELGIRAHLSKYIEQSPENPSNFVMFLRKYLDNAKIISITQLNGDRIIDFFVSKKVAMHLIFEMFAKGNLILTDTDYNIIGSYRFEQTDKRLIKKGQKYVPPENSGKKPSEFAKSLKLFMEEGVPVGFSSIPTEKFPNASANEYSSVSEMVDEYYYHIHKETEKMQADIAHEENPNKRMDKIKHTIKQQEDAFKKFEKESAEFQAAGNYIYENFELTESLLKMVKELKSKKLTDAQITKDLQAAGFKAEYKMGKIFLETV
ncbi:NFACT family protein [Candidatus Micrarchaeota archaeon]|nr:NFACT family protein [Candidatus Micrarchaeota archaeon]